MTLFGGNSTAASGTRKQIFPVDYEAEVSQRLLEAAHSGDLRSAVECLENPLVDVNFVGAVCLKVRRAAVMCHEEAAIEVRIEYEELATDVTTLFVAVCNGNLSLVRKLLSIGADLNQKLFRGFVTTAAVREGHLEILEILLKAGASQPACEEALLEASYHGRAKLVGPLMSSDLIRPHIAVHTLVTACCRGFTEVVDALIKCGVDSNVTDRVLLQSCKPSLHANIDCNALVAAVVSRQVCVVRLLIQGGARSDIMVRLGAWSWDTATGEEFKVGAGLADPYPIAWCAVEYFEKTGTILRMLLNDTSSNTQHLGRTLLHHAILCGNLGALKVLLSCNANIEIPVKTTNKTEFRPIHLSACLGCWTILKTLVDHGCDLNSMTDVGDTALIISAKYKMENCLKVLVSAGADIGLVNKAGQSALSISWSNGWAFGFQEALLDLYRAGKFPKSSDESIFSPLLFVARSGDILALEKLIGGLKVDLDYQDKKGFSAAMVAAMEGHVDAFRLLLYAGADVKLCNKSGETAISLSKMTLKRDLFERVLLEFAIKKGNRSEGFFALHCAARQNDFEAVKLLMNMGYDVNAPDGDGYTPLMLAAREGYGPMCELLISYGARCDLQTSKGETVLLLARKNSLKNEAIKVILDELARVLVLNDALMVKHTKGGKGAPHRKIVSISKETGVLRWGNSRRRNVVCRDACVGGSVNFIRFRERKGDAMEAGVFRVVTTKNKEIHFVCDGGAEVAELWVRGIQLVTNEAVYGRGKRFEHTG